MSNIFQKIKDVLKKIKTKSTSYAKSGVNPTKDWNVMVIITVAVFFVLGILGWYFFNQISDGKLFIIDLEKTQKEVKINSSILDSVVADIHKREEGRKKINAGLVPQPDPSI